MFTPLPLTPGVHHYKTGQYLVAAALTMGTDIMALITPTFPVPNPNPKPKLKAWNSGMAPKRPLSRDVNNEYVVVIIRSPPPYSWSSVPRPAAGR